MTSPAAPDRDRDDDDRPAPPIAPGEGGAHPVHPITEPPPPARPKPTPPRPTPKR
jgi:hypothetical protein